MDFIRKTLTILHKDLLTELRTKEQLSAMLVFALMAAFIFGIALDLSASDPLDTTPGLLWVTIAFAGTLGLNRSLAQEQENRCIDGLLLAPMDRSAILAGKALANLAFISAVEGVIVPVFAVLFNVPLLRGSIALILLLGTLGYAVVGTLFSMMAVNTRAREVMLPILLLPVSLPAFISATHATRAALAGAPPGDMMGWLRLLVAYDVIISVVGWMTFEFVVET
jgi:heme exporter protein B